MCLTEVINETQSLQIVSSKLYTVSFHTLRFVSVADSWCRPHCPNTDESHFCRLIEHSAVLARVFSSNSLSAPLFFLALTICPHLLQTCHTMVSMNTQITKLWILGRLGYKWHRGLTGRCDLKRWVYSYTKGSQNGMFQRVRYMSDRIGDIGRLPAESNQFERQDYRESLQLP